MRVELSVPRAPQAPQAPRARQVPHAHVLQAQHVLRAGARPVRVREQAREAVAVMAFSAATSVGGAVLLLLLTSVGR